MNSRIVETDVVWNGAQPAAPAGSQFAEQFTKCAIAARRPILKEDLRPVPVFAPAVDRFPYFVSLELQSALANVLDAGSLVDLWHDGTPLVREARVAAVVCGTQPPSDCAVVTDVSMADAQNLLRSDPKKVRVIVRRIRE